MSTFKPGDRVYHRNFELHGTYSEQEDRDYSFVYFDRDGGYPDGRRVRVATRHLERAVRSAPDARR